jgi:hypothetical protein
MDIKNSKYEVASVTLTLTARDVSTIAHLYREVADRELEDGLEFLAAGNYEAAAWMFRALGDIYLAEALEGKAMRARTAKQEKTEEEGA